MDSSYASLNSTLLLKPRTVSTFITTTNTATWRLANKKCHYKPRALQISAHSYQRFIQFALNETKRRTLLVPSSLQVLDFGVFPRPEFDVPIFCANFFTTASMNIIVLDLNPLYNVIDWIDYKEKYYKALIPLGVKYAEFFPWGGKLTGESLNFFSPIVIWTKFTSSQQNHDCLFTAFMEYYKAWLDLIEQAAEETDASRVMSNREAQHKYLTWRAEKDPGHGLLKRLVGEEVAKDLMRNFLFDGIGELGSKGFLDYFPEYLRADGTVNEKRSVLGKSFEHRPWDARGEFVGNNVLI